MLAQKLMAAMAGGAEQLFVDDVFQTVVRTGTGSTATVTTGFQPDFVWSKARNRTGGHCVYDSLRGANKPLYTHNTSAQGTETQYLTSFNTNGFSVGSGYDANSSGDLFVDWAAKKAPKFFDVVTYTGNGVAGRQIAHSLGVAPGMIAFKRTDSTSDWSVYHVSTGNQGILRLNLTDAVSTGNTSFLNSTSPTSSVFTLGASAAVNANGATYVAYLFAHDTSADGIIQCGSFTTDGSGNATVNLGWEPQWLNAKRSSTTGDWHIIDSMRGWTANAAAQTTLYANTSQAEGGGWNYALNSTGFSISGLGPSTTVVYMAIRRPNKPPTTGTQVYNAIARTGTGAASTVTGVGFAPDLIHFWRRTPDASHMFNDKLRGPVADLFTNSTSQEDTAGVNITGWNNDGVNIGSGGAINVNTTTYINHFFRRAPGVFDVVCYTGTGSATTVAHGLGVAPELMIFKERTAIGGGSWSVYHQAIGNGNRLVLNTTAATASNTYLNNTTPTASVFSVSTSNLVNASSATYVAYLWATKAGISKVGSYTGNGSSQTINCGFTTGARFVLIKRTDSTGDWYVWDTARGIVAGNDPHLSLNTTAAEVTTNDSIDPDSTGFVVNQLAATNINVNAATYIYLSLA
jgi:hypothetical protein